MGSSVYRCDLNYHADADADADADANPFLLRMMLMLD